MKRTSKSNLNYNNSNSYKLYHYLILLVFISFILFAIIYDLNNDGFYQLPKLSFNKIMDLNTYHKIYPYSNSATTNDVSTIEYTYETINEIKIENYLKDYSKEKLDYTIDNHMEAPSSLVMNISENFNKNKIMSLNTIIESLRNHPFSKLTFNQRYSMQLEDQLLYLQNQSECKNIPIFTSMANVFSDLYWQLIENFIYSMVKFELISCTVMVCVSDKKCMELCNQSNFPCYDFQYDRLNKDKALPSALEQIAELKLYHLPKALNKGVDLMMLDLDVGFISNPMKLIKKLRYSKSDIFVQKDITFVMNRTLIGWRTWFTEPMPNIGLFLVKGNWKTVRMFEMAWKEYQKAPANIKHNPGKDQIKVVLAMRAGRHHYGLMWEYISSHSAVLLDKIYKFNKITTYELGGEAAIRVFNDKDVIAVHTTCYEQKSKVMGLKASNAFWNPIYYHPFRKTITKQLLYITKEQLRNDVRSLLYIAYKTKRDLIIPNILGNELHYVDTLLYEEKLLLWPGFRVLYIKPTFELKINILEPAYYWRIKKDYPYTLHSKLDNPNNNNNNNTNNDNDDNNRSNYKQYDNIIKPTIVMIDNNLNILNIINLLNSIEYNTKNRIILHVNNQNTLESSQDTQDRLIRWADDSVGYFNTYNIESNQYQSLPKLYQKNNKDSIIQLFLKNTRLCSDIFEFDHGNRSCFDKCK